MVVLISSGPAPGPSPSTITTADRAVSTTPNDEAAMQDDDSTPVEHGAAGDQPGPAAAPALGVSPDGDVQPYAVSASGSSWICRQAARLQAAAPTPWAIAMCSRPRPAPCTSPPTSCAAFDPA